MKHIITIFLFVIIGQSLKAQTKIDTSSLLDIALSSDYIIEGQIIEQCTYKGNDGGIYENNIIQISKIGKGNLQCGTVSLITTGGQLNEDASNSSHYSRFSRGFKGVFFLKDYQTERTPIPTTSCVISTTNPNYLITELTDLSYLGYYNDYVNSVVEGVNSQFRTLQEFYDFIQINSPWGLINCSNDILAPVLKEYELSLNDISIPFTNKKLPRKKTRSNDLEFTFSNPTITGNNTKYFEFDVNVLCSSSGTYLDECAFRVKYNPQAFGINIASSITPTLGANFSATTYNNIQKINKTDSVFSIWVHQAVSGQPRTIINTTPDLLMHLKIPLLNCSKYPNMYLDTFATILTYSFYTTASNSASASAVAYNSVVLNDTIAGLLCYPEITSVQSVKTGTNQTGAGIGDTIIVKGKHFGQADSTAGLLLPNADDAGSTLFPIQKYDLLPNGWSDTLIKFILWANYDSTDANPVYNAGYPSATPGAGHITVLNKYKLKDTNVVTNNNFLDIKYCIQTRNYRPPYSPVYFKTNKYLFGYQSSGGYKFLLNSNITNDSMKWCIRSAVNRWRCLTGVNFSIDTVNTTTLQHISFDSVSVILLSDSIGTSNAATSISSRLHYPSINLKPVAGITDIDIEINKNKVFFYDTTGSLNKPAGKLDFYRTILHELGHALQLDHLTDSTELMYCYSKSIADSIPYNKRDLNFSYYNNVSGDYVVDKSVHESLQNVGGLANLPMILQDTCEVTPLQTNDIIKENQIPITVYPNPANTSINFSVPINGTKEIIILDVAGKVINRISFKEQLTTLDISNYQRGIYFAVVKFNYTTKTIKFICE